MHAPPAVIINNQINTKFIDPMNKIYSNQKDILEKIKEMEIQQDTRNEFEQINNLSLN